MTKKLQHLFALSEQGAKDLVRAVIWCFVCNLSLMLPVGAVMATIARLLDVWEASVRATHHFLSDAEVRRIRGYVPEALGGVEHLILAQRAPGEPVAFLGAEGGRLEMLFLSPERRGQGLGRQLLTYGVERWGVRRLDVNEQNPRAREFYEHMGFRITGRWETDGQGRPYPILSMALGR